MQPSPLPRGQRASDIAEKTKHWLHWLFSALLAAAFVFVVAKECLKWDLPGNPNWPEGLLLLLAVAGTITALARQLPLQNVLLAAAIIAFIGGAFQVLGVMTGTPFGPFIFGVDAGPQLFKTLPLTVPLLWIVAVLNARGVARLILRPWRKTRAYGFWLIGLTAALTVLFDLALDPYASRVKHYWLWMRIKFPLTWEGTPVVNFVSWAVVALLILAFATPALINKNPTRRTTDYHPLAVWLGALVLFGVVSARHGLWPAVVLDGASILVTAALAIRGGRW